MENQESRIEDQANGAHETPNGDQRSERGEDGPVTQVGQVLHGLARATRQLQTPRRDARDLGRATPAPPRRAETRANQAALRERVVALIDALGDPTNPLHQNACDDLVAIGEPAVPALNDALGPNRPWLMAYRAAEALGQIGDGRAAGPLLEALRHPNSNVRWSAVRALAVVGDARALIELRRVARDDRGKTSWGESVSGAARSALNHMQSQNMLLRGADLIKTAVACVLMLVALIVAWKIVGDLRTEIRRVGLEPVDPAVVAAAPPTTSATADALLPQATAEPAATPQPEAAPAAAPTAAPTDALTGTVRATGNVRALPQVGKNNVIGGVTEGDEIIFLAATPDGQWYRVRLSDRHATGSRIDSNNGAGWVNRSLLSTPTGDVPVEDVPLPTPAPATPAPEATAAP